MANRQVKIKRYRTVGAAGRGGSRTAVRVLAVVLIAAVIFAVGWFGAKPTIDAITNFWYTHISVSRQEASSVPESLPDSLPDSDPEDLQSRPEAEPEPAPEPVSDASGTWGEVALSALNSEDSLRAALSALQQAGADHAVVTLKDERGYIYYASGVEMAAEAVRAQADLALFVRLCGEYGLAPCARLEAFLDPLTPYAYRDAAVHYERQGVLWLDTSAELGGKPWFNPYSQQARGYVLALAQELAAAGMTDIVFAGVQFPTGYALEFCYYGENAAQLSRTDCLRECVAMLQTTLAGQGVNSWFEWPAEAALGAVGEAAQPLVYGDGPAALGAQRVLLRPEAVRGADGVVQLPEADSAALAAFVAAAQAAGTGSFALDTGALAAAPDIAAAWVEAAQAAGFTHFRSALQ